VVLHDHVIIGRNRHQLAELGNQVVSQNVQLHRGITEGANTD
jgi:hypothetical protein